MAGMSANSFGARGRLTVGETSYDIFRLDAIEGSQRLPYSLKVLLENLLRCEDGMLVGPGQVAALAAWDPQAEHGGEIQFTPARVLMQDFTGVPCVVDLVAMRDAMASLGGDPSKINPLIPAELVIDHSVIADVFARSDAFRVNADLEFERNKERATSCCAGPSKRSTISWWYRPTPASVTRSISNTLRVSCSPRTGRPRWPIPTPWSAPTRTPA